MDPNANTNSAINDLDAFMQEMPDFRAQTEAQLGGTKSAPAEAESSSTVQAGETEPAEVSEEERVFDKVQSMSESDLQTFLKNEAANLNEGSKLIVMERLLTVERTRLSDELQNAKLEAEFSPLGSQGRVSDLEGQLARNSEQMVIVQSGRLPETAAAPAAAEASGEEDMRHLEDFSERAQRMTAEEKAAFSASPEGQAMAAESSQIAADLSQRLDDAKREAAAQDAFNALGPDDLLSDSSPEDRAEIYAQELEAAAEPSPQAFPSPPVTTQTLQTETPSSARSLAPPLVQVPTPVTSTSGEGVGRNGGPSQTQIGPTQGFNSAVPEVKGQNHGAGKLSETDMVQNFMKQKQIADRASAPDGPGQGVIGGTISATAQVGKDAMSFLWDRARDGYSMWSKNRYEAESAQLRMNLDSFKANVKRFNEATTPGAAAAASSALKADMVNLRSSMGEAVVRAGHLKPSERGAALAEIQSDFEEVRDAAGQLQPGSGLDPSLQESMREMAEAIHRLFERFGRYVSEKISAVVTSLGLGVRQAGPSASPSPTGAPPPSARPGAPFAPSAAPSM